MKKKKLGIKKVTLRDLDAAGGQQGQGTLGCPSANTQCIGYHSCIQGGTCNGAYSCNGGTCNQTCPYTCQVPCGAAASMLVTGCGAGCYVSGPCGSAASGCGNTCATNCQCQGYWSMVPQTCPTTATAACNPNYTCGNSCTPTPSCPAWYMC